MFHSIEDRIEALDGLQAPLRELWWQLWPCASNELPSALTPFSPIRDGGSVRVGRCDRSRWHLPVYSAEGAHRARISIASVRRVARSPRRARGLATQGLGRARGREDAWVTPHCDERRVGTLGLSPMALFADATAADDHL